MQQIKESVGLKFNLINNGTEYEVVGIGDCKDVELVIPPIYNGKPVSSIGERAFDENERITSVIIPDSVVKISRCAFSSCEWLENVHIGFNVAVIGDDAFYCCENISSITIPASVKVIGSNAFSFCYNLESVVFDDNAILESLGDRAFRSCEVLKEIIIPNSVKTIGEEAFYLCSELSSIIFNGTIDEWKAIAGKRFNWFFDVDTNFVQCSDGKSKI